MKFNKNVVESDLRARVFDDLMSGRIEDYAYEYTKVNDRQFGCLMTDKNGHQRYVRIGVIVAEEREDITARELMQKEIDDYNAKQADKAEKAAKRAEKAEADKARREAKAKEKGE